MQSRFKIQLSSTACGQLQWQREASERFEFQYPESMWYNVSKEQAASSCLPTRPVQPSVDGVFILCSLEVSVFWFVTVDQDHCRKAFFSLRFVFWYKMSVIVSHTQEYYCLGISCKWTKTKYEMQSKENDVYINCIQTDKHMWITKQQVWLTRTRSHDHQVSIFQERGCFSRSGRKHGVKPSSEPGTNRPIQWLERPVGMESGPEGGKHL